MIPDDSSGKEAACQCGRCRSCGFNPWLGKIPWRRQLQSTPAASERPFKSVWIYACLSVCLWLWIILLRFICKWAPTQLALKESKHLAYHWWLSGKASARQCRRWVRSLVWEDCTCCRATKPVQHHHWTTHAVALVVHKRSNYNEKLMHHN